MNKRVCAVVALTAMLAPVTTVAAEASDESVARDTRGCVTKAEFKRVHKGMRKRRVHRIFDTRGKGSATTREYRACHRPAASYIGLVYKTNGRLYSKTAFFAP